MKKYNSMYVRWTDADDLQLLEMLESGASSGEVAKALGRTRASVWNRKNKLGLDGRFRRSTGKNVPPVSVLKKQRNTTSQVVEPIVETQTVPNVDQTLQRAAELAKSLGVSVSVITFNP